MSASLLASFTVFIVTGAYTLFVQTDITSSEIERSVELIVGLTILVNGIFYFVIVAITEMDGKVVSNLRNVKGEWWIRVANESLLFGLWFSLQMSWSAFGITLILLYLSFLFWDAMTLDYIEEWIIVVDFLGLILSGFFIFIGGKMLSDADITGLTYLIMGAIVISYGMLCVIGAKKGNLLGILKNQMQRSMRR